MLHGAHNNAAMYYGSFCSLLAGRPPPPPRPRHQEVPPPQRQQRVRTRTHDDGRRASPDSPRSTTPPPEPLQLPDDTLGWDALAGRAAKVDALKVALAVLLMPDARRAPRASTKNGVLLTGPPGTGKTLAVRLLTGRAKALNGGTAVPLWVGNGGKLLSKFIGEGEQRVRRVIDAATAAQPSIIFFDEFEAITAARTDGRQESIPMIATLLALLDGLVRRDRVFVVAATNRVDLIDRAFRRPGRFGTELPFGLPDAAGRWAIMRVSAAAEGVRMTAEDATRIADHKDDWLRAEIAGLCDDASTTVFARRFFDVARLVSGGYRQRCRLACRLEGHLRPARTVHAARGAAAPAAAAPSTRVAAADTDADQREGVSHLPLSRPPARVDDWALRRSGGSWVRRGHCVQRHGRGPSHFAPATAH